MKAGLTAAWAAADSLRREPLTSEVNGGFPCGPLDDKLFNELEFRSTSAGIEIVNVITAAGLTPDEDVLTQLLQALRILYGPVVRGSVAYITAGVHNFTVPANVTRVRVRMVGGGGAGGYSTASVVAGGGGAGGYSEGLLTVTPGAVIPATVGAGGAPPSSGNNGATGGTSSFLTMSATGGIGGLITPSVSGGRGGLGAGGSILNIYGGHGTDGPVSGTLMGGIGGGSYFGGGSRASSNTIVLPDCAPGGGGGSIYSGQPGGIGGQDGCVLIEW